MFKISNFKYDRATKVLCGCFGDLGINSFPTEISVTSDHTGHTITFIPDHQSALDHEFWDGEMMEYVPEKTTIPHNVKRLVVISG